MPFVKHFREYTLFKLFDDFKGKVVLDLPGSIGHYSLKFLEKGASHVICSGLIPEELQVAEEVFIKAGIEANRYTIVEHDAKIPLQLTEKLADIAVVLHLFCFADNYEELVYMAKCIFLNMKENGEMISFHCPPMARDKLEFYEKANNAKIIRYNHPIEELNLPGFLHTEECCFTLTRNIWPIHIVEKALKDGGFKDVRKEEYLKDPSYVGEIPLDYHTEYADFYFLVARK